MKGDVEHATVLPVFFVDGPTLPLFAPDTERRFAILPPPKSTTSSLKMQRRPSTCMCRQESGTRPTSSLFGEIDSEIDSDDKAAPGLAHFVGQTPLPMM
jgi:hypothetical protein